MPGRRSAVSICSICQIPFAFELDDEAAAPDGLIHSGQPPLT
jgi:hypothetical protein